MVEFEFEFDSQQLSLFQNLQKLKDNAISGQITEEMITNGWQKMIDLDTSVNRLVGPIPANIWSMSNLEVCYLFDPTSCINLPTI